MLNQKLIFVVGTGHLSTEDITNKIDEHLSLFGEDVNNWKITNISATPYGHDNTRSCCYVLIEKVK